MEENNTVTIPFLFLVTENNAIKFRVLGGRVMKETSVITEFLPVSDREKQHVFSLGKKPVKDEKKIAK